MKVGKLERLFQALDSSADQAKNSKIAEFPKQLPSGGDEAVRVAKNFGSTGEAQESSGKDLQAIKDRYVKGAHKPSAEDFAKVLVRDLF